MTEANRLDYEIPARESLLNVVLDKLQKAGKTVITSRLIFVAKLARRESNVDYHRAFFAKLIDKYFQEGEVTGLLLCYPNCAVHLLEGKTSILMSILRDVLAAGPAETRFSEARVVASTEDVPTRCFSGWYAAFVNTMSSADSMDPADSTTIVKTASEVNAFMRKVGSSLTGQSDSELRRRLMSFEAYYEDVPAPEVVLSLIPAEDAPTLEEYLEIFDAPLNIDLDSEQVWPMPARLRV